MNKSVESAQGRTGVLLTQCRFAPPPHQAYKVSNFEQRLMSEIEFRLERTPVEESDEEVQHDEVPTGRCIAPIFDKKLKNFRAMEGVPVTLSCKLVGIPIPKVGGLCGTPFLHGYWLHWRGGIKREI